MNGWIDRIPERRVSCLALMGSYFFMICSAFLGLAAISSLFFLWRSNSPSIILVKKKKKEVLRGIRI